MKKKRSNLQNEIFFEFEHVEREYEIRIKRVKKNFNDQIKKISRIKLKKSKSKRSKS